MSYYQSKIGKNKEMEDAGGDGRGELEGNKEEMKNKGEIERVFAEGKGWLVC